MVLDTLKKLVTSNTAQRNTREPTKPNILKRIFGSKAQQQTEHSGQAQQALDKQQQENTNISRNVIHQQIGTKLKEHGLSHWQGRASQDLQNMSPQRIHDLHSKIYDDYKENSNLSKKVKELDSKKLLDQNNIQDHLIEKLKSPRSLAQVQKLLDAKEKKTILANELYTRMNNKTQQEDEAAMKDIMQDVAIPLIKYIDRQKLNHLTDNTLQNIQNIQPDEAIDILEKKKKLDKDVQKFKSKIENISFGELLNERQKTSKQINELPSEKMTIIELETHKALDEKISAADEELNRKRTAFRDDFVRDLPEQLLQYKQDILNTFAILKPAEVNEVIKKHKEKPLLQQITPLLTPVLTETIKHYEGDVLRHFELLENLDRSDNYVKNKSKKKLGLILNIQSDYKMLDALRNEGETRRSLDDLKGSTSENDLLNILKKATNNTTLKNSLGDKKNVSDATLQRIRSTAMKNFQKIYDKHFGQEIGSLESTVLSDAAKQELKTAKSLLDVAYLDKNRGYRDGYNAVVKAMTGKL